ncbi:MAG TPA: flagellar hook protein FlgE [Firmicutes bacterium]|nr:flagellar hook protein FlgE [Bacillota bacterium]
MMRSLFSAVSGLRSHQTAMDVIGENIANVNTVGYKTSRVIFKEMFSQTIKGASSPTGAQGGTNPQQVGLGVSLSSVDTIHSQGNLQPSGRITDMAIEGNGFFVLKEGERRYYTRAGNFDLDANGVLVDSAGRRVLGWMATNGVFGTRTDSTLTAITIPIGQQINATPTTRAAWYHNLDSRAVNGTTRTTSMVAFDSLGNAHQLTVTFTKVDVNKWDWSVSGSGGVTASGSGHLVFDTTGNLQSSIVVDPVTVDLSALGANNLTIQMDFSRVTQNADDSTVELAERDGAPPGSLETVSVDELGVISGVYSNGLSRPLAQVALAMFPNPGGLSKSGAGVYEESNNSGPRQIDQPGSGGRGKIAPSALELSNVDLANEFTAMITTQRGFQANSRVITASDEMLQELVNLKRS